MEDLAKISFQAYPWKDTSWYKPTGMYRDGSRTVYFQYQDIQQPKVGLLISSSFEY